MISDLIMSDRKEFSQSSITNTFSFHCGKNQEETVNKDKVEIQEVTVSLAAAKEISMDAVVARGFSVRQQRIIAS